MFVDILFCLSSNNHERVPSIGAHEHVLPRRRRGVHAGRGAAHGPERIVDVRGDRQGSDP